MITVLVADDMRLVRRLLAQQLARETDISVVAEAQDGRQAVELCLSLSPDVVLMDLSMPRMNGIEAMERIKALRPNTRVVLLSAHEELVSLGRISGAEDCLDKNCTPQELTSTIRRVTHLPRPKSRNVWQNGTVRRSGNGGAAAGEPLCATVERLAARSGMTAREKAVLTLLVSTDLTIAQIAAELSESLETLITETAVKHTTERVMNKLAIEPRTRFTLVKFVLEQGRPETPLGYA